MQSMTGDNPQEELFLCLERLLVEPGEVISWNRAISEPSGRVRTLRYDIVIAGIAEVAVPSGTAAVIYVQPRQQRR